MGKLIELRRRLAIEQEQRNFCGEGERAVGDSCGEVKLDCSIHSSGLPLPEDYNQVLFRLIDRLSLREKHIVSDSLMPLAGQRFLMTSFSAEKNSPVGQIVFRLATAVRRLICRGARPVLVHAANTHLSQHSDGVAEACAEWGIPLVGSADTLNVTNFVVGIIAPKLTLLNSVFKADGDILVLLGEPKEGLTGSAYLQQTVGIEGGELPEVRLQREKRLHQLLYTAREQGLLKSARSCAEGGLTLALADGCCSSGLGARVKLRAQGLRPDAVLFGEAPSRALVSVAPENLQALQEMGMDHRILTGVIGRVEGAALKVAVASRQWQGIEEKEIIYQSVKEMATRWRNSTK